MISSAYYLSKIFLMARILGPSDSYMIALRSILALSVFTVAFI